MHARSKQLVMMPQFELFAESWWPVRCFKIVRMKKITRLIARKDLQLVSVVLAKTDCRKSSCGVDGTNVPHKSVKGDIVYVDRWRAYDQSDKLQPCNSCCKLWIANVTMLRKGNKISQRYATKLLGSSLCPELFGSLSLSWNTAALLRFTIVFCCS